MKKIGKVTAIKSSKPVKLFLLLQVSHLSASTYRYVLVINPHQVMIPWLFLYFADIRYSGASSQSCDAQLSDFEEYSQLTIHSRAL